MNITQSSPDPGHQATLHTAWHSRRTLSSESINLTRLVSPSLTFVSNPQMLLDQLSDSCSITSCLPNSLIVSVSALSHLSHIQFTWPGFLENIKIAAGKSGTETSKEDARLWLSAKIAEDQVSARSILVHAGQLSSLLLRYTFESVPQVV